MFILIYVLFWFVLFGAVIGSFLNVVIYRFPLGKSLSYPPSHCPKCEHPIRWNDNVPVFGWILLKGRCRDCQAPISVRYPLVEAFCALMFAVVGFFVLYRFMGLHEIENVLQIPMRIWGLIACLLVLVTTLFVAGMIECDGQNVPVRLYVPVFFAVLIALAMEINLAPFAYDKTGPLSRFVSLIPFIPQTKPSPIFDGLINVLLGGLCGFLCSLIVAPCWSKGQRIPWCTAMLCTGLFLGWQLALCCALILFLYGLVYVVYIQMLIYLAPEQSEPEEKPQKKGCDNLKNSQTANNRRINPFEFHTQFSKNQYKRMRTAPTLLLFFHVMVFIALFS